MVKAVTAPDPPLFQGVQTTDFDELAQGVPGWDVAFSQLSPGPFYGALDLVKLPAVRCYRIALNREILGRGSRQPGTFLFSVSTQQQESSIWSGRPMRNGQVTFLGPNETVDHKTCAGYHAYFLEIKAEALRAAAQALTGRDVDADLAGKVLLSPRPRATRRLEAGIWEILDLARAPANLLHQSDVQRELLDVLLAHLADVIGDARAPDTSCGRFGNRRRLVQEAESLMDSRPQGGWTILNLCQELRVSERGLHYAFREMLGQSPMAFYRHKRLNAVRRLLKETCPLQTTVAEAGRAHGFWHTGHFAADYHRLFGELPSTTLAAQDAG